MWEETMVALEAKGQCRQPWRGDAISPSQKGNTRSFKPVYGARDVRLKQSKQKMYNTSATAVLSKYSYLKYQTY